MPRKKAAVLIAALGIAWITAGCESVQTRTTSLAEFAQQLTVPISGSRLSIGMVYISGDQAKGIKPFYISRYEVSWRQFYDWMYITDIEDPRERWRLISEGLRPSPLQEILATTFQVYDADYAHPAMGMTQLSAQSYCIWLSEMTGRRYRLPTLNEWRHAAELGGGLPSDFDAAVLHKDNAPEHEFEFRPLTLPAASKQPDAMGVHDLFGSVAEWVTNPDGPALIVGGSINNQPAEISAHWQAEENIEIWSETYPQRPHSRFWYMDYYYTGIRLVCEADSVVSHSAKPTE